MIFKYMSQNIDLFQGEAFITYYVGRMYQYATIRSMTQFQNPVKIDHLVVGPRTTVVFRTVWGEKYVYDNFEQVNKSYELFGDSIMTMLVFPIGEGSECFSTGNMFVPNYFWCLCLIVILLIFSLSLKK